ncbi:MAG: hypothetical protein JKY02_08370 [Flavobacteriaceae bacterium]|nr:hypothetical protein [Flavobacteriaceae bacterium]
MNIRIAIVLLIFFYKTSYSQVEEWNTYDFDSIVAIDMPFEVYEIDSIIDNRRNYQIYSENDSSKFIAQKLYLGKVYSNVESVPLPYDNNSLEKYYSDIIWMFTEGFKYDLNHTKPINKFNLKGYKLTFNDSNGLPVHETSFFIANKNFYSFSYINTNGLNEIERKKFFDSIIFDSEIELKQYYEKTSFINKKTMLILLSVLLLSFLLRVKSKTKSN